MTARKKKPEGAEAPETSRTPLDEFLDSNPAFLDAHAQWLAAGGDRFVQAMLRTVRGEAWPFNAEPHTQAAFGAYCAGIQWVARLHEALVPYNRRRVARLEALASGDQMDSRDMTDEVRALLRESGYTDAELAAPNTPKKGR
jgi:hypothetical protein